MYAGAENPLRIRGDAGGPVVEPRYRMLLNNLLAQRKLVYSESIVVDGLRHNETWTATIIIINGAAGQGINTFTARANTKQAAREAASQQALAFLTSVEDVPQVDDLVSKPASIETMPSSPRARSSQDTIPISLSAEITRLEHKTTPATEPLILLLQTLGKDASRATRNKHNIYAIIIRARDLCNYILAIGVRSEFNGIKDLDEYCNLIDAIEGVLLDVARLLPSEQVPFGPEMCASWSKSREEFREILGNLHKPPFNLVVSSQGQEFENNAFFDDCYWLSLLLHEGIEKEFARRRQYLDTALPLAVTSVREGLHHLENEIKCGYCDGAARDLVIDIATQLYETLSASAPNEAGNSAPPIQPLKSPGQIQLDEESLFASLANAFSSLDLDFILQTSNVQKLAQQWWHILSERSAAASSGAGQRKSEESIIQNPVPAGNQKPASFEDRYGVANTPLGVSGTSNSSYFMLLHNLQQQRTVSFLEATFPQGPRDRETWTTTITVTSSPRGPNMFTGIANDKQAAREAASKQALTFLGYI